MHSIRFQILSFILALLLVLLLLLNTYPLISSRDAIFEEKRSSMTASASERSILPLRKALFVNSPGPAAAAPFLMHKSRIFLIIRIPP